MSGAFDLKKAIEQMETPKPATEKEWADLYYSAKDAVREIEMYKDAIFGKAGWKKEVQHLKKLLDESYKREDMWKNKKLGAVRADLRTEIDRLKDTISDINQAFVEGKIKTIEAILKDYNKRRFP